MATTLKRKKRKRKQDADPPVRYSYPAEFQANVVRLMLCDPGFLMGHRKALDAEYFTDPELSWVAEQALRIYDKAKVTPTPGTLLARVSGKNVPEGIDPELATTRARSLYKKGVPRDAAVVTEEVVNFGRHQRLKAVMAEGPTFLEDGAYERFRDAVQEAVAVTADAAVEVYDYERRTTERIDEYEKALNNAVPTNSTAINRILQGGGLGPGEMGIFMGLPGFHKTTWLCNIGYAARAHGLNVFHATFEVSAVKTARRYDCRIAGMNLEQTLINRGKVKRKIERFNTAHPGALRLRWWPGRACTMAELEQQIRWLEANRGFKVGMVVADYVAKMRPAGRYDAANTRFGIAELYSDFRAMCGALGVPGWTAIQANRAGFKSSTDDEVVLTEENAADAFDPIRDADVVLTLNQTRAERAENRMRVYVAKNRDGVSQQTLRFRVHPDRYTITDIGQAVAADAEDSEEQGSAELLADEIERAERPGPSGPPPAVARRV